MVSDDSDSYWGDVESICSSFLTQWISHTLRTDKHPSTETRSTRWMLGIWMSYTDHLYLIGSLQSRRFSECRTSCWVTSRKLWLYQVHHHWWIDSGACSTRSLPKFSCQDLLSSLDCHQALCRFVRFRRCLLKESLEWAGKDTLFGALGETKVQTSD